MGTPKPTPTSLAKLRDTPAEKRKIISSHRRSRSLIPIIKIDHFDNIETPRRLSAELLKIEPRISESINPLPTPYHFTICLDGSLPKSGGSTGNMVVGVGDRPGFRLFNPKSWGKDRPKVERRSSSPQLCQLPLATLTGSAASHKQSNSSGKFKACSSSKGETKSVTRKVIRKAKSSYNVRDSEYLISTLSKCYIMTSGFEGNANAEPPPPVPRNVEKKRSQTLRTQPYEAPYFCTPPMPMPVRKSPRSNLRSPPPPLPSHSLDRKLSKPLLSNS